MSETRAILSADNRRWFWPWSSWDCLSTSSRMKGLIRVKTRPHHKPEIDTQFSLTEVGSELWVLLIDFLHVPSRFLLRKSSIMWKLVEYLRSSFLFCSTSVDIVFVTLSRTIPYAYTVYKRVYGTPSSCTSRLLPLIIYNGEYQKHMYNWVAS